MTLEAVRMLTYKPLESAANIQRKIAEGKDNKVAEKLFGGEVPEIILFQKKDEFVRNTPKITEVSKPVAEQAKVATASVNKPLFDMQSPSDRFVAYSAGSIFGGLATSSGLRASEQGSNAGDKKDGKNTFISAQKSLNDLRLEKLEGDGLRNIFCGVC